MTNLEEAILEITRFLGQKNIPYMLIGGVANIFFGVPRATIDIDITIKVDELQLESFVNDLVSTFKPFPPDPVKFVKETRVLPVKTSSGIRIDIIFGQLPYENSAIARAHDKQVGKEQVKVCSPEDLIIHKIISERAKDREDVEGIINTQRDKLNRAYLDPIIKQLSKELCQSDVMEFYKKCLGKG
ncbi:MAG: nucleotidyl transferase AbiEii/AbiGii toxin family protein [Deltaproteobacteria bacterium]|nr:nucleotidyl transferase AbiEii/AbiGii toxin family protein [Deltaproteobacteria bacterium]MBI2974211.1 nucleotidyl transferase AbiEii/AbiGii toxin family protein [Deltaproteobacteria bacterium]